MPTPDLPVSIPPSPLHDAVIPKSKNADIEPVKPLSAKTMKSVELLMAEILSPDSVEVTLDAPHNIRSMKSGEARKRHSTIDFGDVETYNAVIDRFLLNFGDSPKFLSNTSFVIENSVVFENPAAPDSPIYARIHVLAPPATKIAKVTIAKAV